jgi:hypothetical protein
MSRFVALLLVAGLAGPCAAAPADPAAKERRQELDALRKEVFRKTLLARADVEIARPSPGLVTELEDGSYYENADPSIGFEELGAVRVDRMSLRDGRVLLVTLAPPTTILAPQMRSKSAPDVGVSVLMEVELGDGDSVRDGLASLVYMPGEPVPQEAIDRCLARYPGHDAERSAVRCGLRRKADSKR